jgi:methyltransferase
VSPAYAILGLVAVERLGELLLAARNVRWLRAQGAVEIGAGHYPLFILLHGSWFVAMVIAVLADQPVQWPLILLFALLQLGRLWVLLTLGRYWTTRIITVPDRPLVTAGPYRWLRHPNYWVVAIEIPLLPLAFGAWKVALIWGALNGLLLNYRIRIEESTLLPRRTSSQAGAAR